MAGGALPVARRPPYRKENGVTIIDVALSDIRLLFSALDPSPIRDKDLDPSTEDYIVAAAREIGHDPFKVVFHVPAEQFSGLDISGLQDSLRNYFSYRAWSEGDALGRLRRTAWMSLGIGLSFLALCLVAREFLTHTDGTGFAILREGLLISGWVAMWRPIELILYDWWPLWRLRRLYDRLSAAAVEFQPQERALSAKPFQRNGAPASQG